MLSVFQMPERSGFPSAVCGTGAFRLGLPSAVRGVPGSGTLIHCADAVAAVAPTNASATSPPRQPAIWEIRMELTPRRGAMLTPESRKLEVGGWKLTTNHQPPATNRNAYC